MEIYEICTDQTEQWIEPSLVVHEGMTVEGLSLPLKFDSGSREHRGRNRESSTRTWSLYSIIYPFIGRFLLV